MTRFRLAPGLLVGLIGLAAAFAMGQRACGDVMKTLYVSPAGDDANPGTKDQPLATLGGARDAVRQVNRDMTGDIVVVLAGGTYSISKPVVFDHRDSATGGHQIVYRSRRRRIGRHQRRPGHHRLATRRRRTLEGIYQPEQLPPVVRGRKTGRAGTGRCVARRRTPRPGRLQDNGGRDGRLEKPAGHRVLLLRGLVPHAVQGAEHPAGGRPSGRHHAPAPLHQCPREGGRAGESAQLHRKRLGVARRARRVVSRPGCEDRVLQAASGPGHEPRSASSRRPWRSWSSCGGLWTNPSRTSTSWASPLPRPAGSCPARSAWSTCRPTSC